MCQCDVHVCRLCGYDMRQFVCVSPVYIGMCQCVVCVSCHGCWRGKVTLTSASLTPSLRPPVRILLPSIITKHPPPSSSHPPPFLTILFEYITPFFKTSSYLLPSLNRHLPPSLSQLTSFISQRSMCVYVYYVQS